MELRDYLAILRKRWITVALVTVLGLVLAAAASLLMTPQYEARARLYVAVVSGENVGDLTQTATYAERQLASYAEMATSPLVLEPVSDQAGESVLADNISVTPGSGTTILDIVASHEDPARAAEIANAISEQLIITIQEVTPAPAGEELVSAQVMQTAAAPSDATQPNVPVNLALGFMAGLAVGLGIAVIREVLDTRVRTERDVESLSEAPILGVFRYDEKESEHPLYMVRTPSSERSEAMRRLRTNLQFVDLGQAKSIVVTSSLPGEGKSTTSVNLAIALADSGQRVVLVDCDLRRPDVANYTGLEGRAGLTTALIGQAELDDVIQPWLDGKLDVLTSGQLPPNPSELLGSMAMKKALEELDRVYDVIVIDSPPLLPVADSAILTKIAGGALVVVGADRIHKGQLSQALHNLETVDGKILGAVLNKVSDSKTGGYSYSYTYTYEAEPTADLLASYHPSVRAQEASTVRDLERARRPETTPRSSQEPFEQVLASGSPNSGAGSWWPGAPRRRSQR